MSKITSEDVLKVAKLARLDIPKDELETYTNQLEKILGYVEHLNEVDTTDIMPTARAVEVVNIFRKDNVFKNKSREEILDQAPLREGDFYRVPKILSE